MLNVIHIKTFLQSKLIVKPHGITSVQTQKKKDKSRQKKEWIFFFLAIKKQQPGPSQNHKLRD